MPTLRSVFGIGVLPRELRSRVDGEGPLVVREGIAVAYAFSGRLPGFVATRNTRSYSGALALTRKGLLGTLSMIPLRAGRAIDQDWEAESGPLEVRVDQDGLHMSIDISKVDAEWHGTLTLDYDVKLSSAEVDALPHRVLAFASPIRGGDPSTLHEWVLRLIGLPS
jgi:hypothetical protein